MEWGADNPQSSHSPCSHLGQAAGKPRAVRAGGVPVFSCVTPAWLCWGQGHAWGTALDPGPLQRPLMAACSVGKQLRAGPRGAESSVEMLLGRGCCGEKH